MHSRKHVSTRTSRWLAAALVAGTASVSAVTGLGGVQTASAAVVGGPVLALAPANILLGFNAATPGTITRTTTITGLVAGETVVGMDVRPATGELYAVGVGGTSAHLYALNASNGVATVVNATALSTTLPAGGTWSVDFNPTADRVRFVHSTGISYRINPLDGTLAATDTAVAPAKPAALAYDRSTATTPSATTLFTIDATASTLNLIGGVDGTPSPNAGATTSRGALGVTLTSADVGFDIAPAGDALSTLNVGGSTGLYTLNLTTGAATLVGVVGAGTTPILDIALPRPPVGAVLALATNNVVLGFDASNPGFFTSAAAITGRQAGEDIVGIDVRPATGEVIAVGVKGTEGRVYRLDPATGALTQIGTAPFATNLPAGGSWSVDFNPVPDRIRFVHSSGASYRLNPANGALAATDTAVAPAKPTALAYDRPIATTTATTLYSIDDTSSTLNLIGSPDGAPVSPNSGTTTARGPLGVTLDSDDVGFDITTVGEAIATLSVANSTGFYTIDLASGAASFIGTVGFGNLDIMDITALPKTPVGAAQFTAVSPTRLLDTRDGTGNKPGANSTIDLAVTGVGGVPANATAVVLNVTGTEASANGFVTAYPTGEARPLASNNNLAVDGTKASLSTTKVGANGRVSIFVQNGAHIVVDVLGYYAPATSGAGRFNPVTPARLIDTRDAGNAKVAANGTVAVQVTGRGGIPATGVSAVVVDLTGTDATVPGYVTAYATGSTQPTTSNLNLERAGGTVSNLAIVPVGTDGKITVFSQNGAHIVVDVAGWFSDSTGKGGPRGLYVPVSPSRVLDTRTGLGAPQAALAQGASVDLVVAGAGGVPATGASGVVVNVTSVDAVAPGFVTVYPTGATRPVVASLNVDAIGQVVPNLVATGLGTQGRVSIFAHAGGNLVADVAGWFIG